MANKKWDDVFKVYPEAKEIFVCNGQPFLTKKQAEQHKQECNRVKKLEAGVGNESKVKEVSVEVVVKADKKAQTAAEKKAAAEAKKAQAESEKKAAAAEKKAKAESEKKAAAEAKK